MSLPLRYVVARETASKSMPKWIVLTLSLIYTIVKSGSAAEHGRRSGGRQAAVDSPAAPVRGG